MAETAPAVVCFDLGGVIVRICRDWAQGCARAGVPVRPGPPPCASALDGAIRDHQTGAIGLEPFARRMSAAFGGRYSPGEVLAVHDAWVIGPYPDLERVIERVHAAGVATAALSNTDAQHWAALQSVRPISMIRHRMASQELGLRKPDPAIYGAAEQLLGVTGPAILFFDDLPENVAAAEAVGWRAVRVDPTRETAPQIEAALGRHGL